jgi:alpha-L-rhamnosidase
VTGTAGQTVIMRHAEVLQHPPYGPADGSIYQGNLRTALATDTFTLRGDPQG